MWGIHPHRGPGHTYTDEAVYGVSPCARAPHAHTGEARIRRACLCAPEPRVEESIAFFAVREREESMDSLLRGGGVETN